MWFASRWPCGRQAISLAERLASGETGFALRFPLEGFTEVRNPFGQAREQGLDLNALYREDPVAGAAKVAELAEGIRAEGPTVYVLEGAEPTLCSPMQYGGQYLETDRETLLRLCDKVTVVLRIKAGTDAYLDFVSDLPAHVFAWDAHSTGFSLGQMRALRQGPLATNEPGADYFLETSAAEAVA